MTPNPILDPLNPAQRDAVVAVNGPVLVIAGAGSGKTRVITHRIAHLVEDHAVDPRAIFAATFTNKAAEEMRHRIKRMLPGYETASLTIATFHSICVRILRREFHHIGLTQRFTIADDSDQIALLKDCLRELDIPKATLAPESVRSWISQAKILMATAAEVEQALYRPQDDVFREYGTDPRKIRENLTQEPMRDYVRAYAMYEARLQSNDAVDFDDLLMRVVRLLVSEPEVLRHYQNRWKYYLVDEYQDTNHVQCALVSLLSGRDGNLCVVGDEDQCIYSWRGAEIEHILQFPQEYEGTQIIRLEQNYRSTQTILKAAESVIEHNTQRHGKHLFSERGAGAPISRLIAGDEHEEAALVVDTIRLLRRTGVPYRDCAIFYRVNALSRLFEDMLRQSNIPYRVVGGVRFYDRMEIKDLLAYLRLTVNPHDGISLSRILNKPRRGLGDKSQQAFFSEASAKNISLYTYLREALEHKVLPKRVHASVLGLMKMISEWGEFAINHRPTEILERVLRDTGYEASLGDARQLDTLSRLENIEELRRALEDYQTNNSEGTMGEYLEMISLTQATDQLTDADDCVSLMTLHSAKGLEFPCVFLTGLEEGIFPSNRAVQEGNFEEERRLFYVGVTRAQDRLFICRADSRTLYGRHVYNPPSSFWVEIPEELTCDHQIVMRDLEMQPADSPYTRSHSAPVRGSKPSQRSSPRAFADPAAEAVSEEGVAYPPGSRVRHKTLGEGEVMTVKGEGDRRKISIRFDVGLELEVLEQYGGLELVNEMPF